MDKIKRYDGKDIFLAYLIGFLIGNLVGVISLWGGFK